MRAACVLRRRAAAAGSHACTPPAATPRTCPAAAAAASSPRHASTCAPLLLQQHRIGRHADAPGSARCGPSSSSSLSRLLSTGASSAPAPPPSWRSALESAHPANNVPPSIRAKAGTNLLLRQGHPLACLKQTIERYFAAGGHEGLSPANAPFRCFDSLPPVVSVAQNFDELLTPADHPSRAPTDTFYVDGARVLRCHMTAHQTELLRAGHSSFLMAGEVYRRDAVDATHYPIFHQVDGVRVWAPEDLPPHVRGGSRAEVDAFVMGHLKASLEGMVRALFGPGTEHRWIEATFPFTDPSLELEVKLMGVGGRVGEATWLEVLGCGRVRDDILAACGRPAGTAGWAFGMGVERLAMVLHAIPDIRLFWSEDPRFLSQFAAGAGAGPGGRAAPVRFQPFSKQPACYKDVTFWLPKGREAAAAAPGSFPSPPAASSSAAAPLPAAAAAAAAAAAPASATAPAASAFHENDVAAVVREVAGDLAESVTLLDAFTNKKTGRSSHCYRVLYRSMERSLTNEEVDGMQEEVTKRLVGQLGVELR